MSKLTAWDSLSLLYKELELLAPKLSFQPYPRNLAQSSELIKSLCTTDEQVEAVAASKELKDTIVVGKLDIEAKAFRLNSIRVVKSVHERQIVDFIDLMTLVLNDETEKYTPVLETFLRVNGHETNNMVIAKKAINLAYNIHILLQAFPKIPISVEGKSKKIRIDESTDIIADVVKPILQ